MSANSDSPCHPKFAKLREVASGRHVVRQHVISVPGRSTCSGLISQTGSRHFTHATQAIPGVDPGSMLITPDNLQSIISRICQLNGPDIIWHAFWLERPHAGNFINTLRTRALATNQLEGQSRLQPIGPVDLEDGSVFVCAKSLWRIVHGI